MDELGRDGVDRRVVFATLDGRGEVTVAPERLEDVLEREECDRRAASKMLESRVAEAGALERWRTLLTDERAFWRDSGVLDCRDVEVTLGGLAFFLLSTSLVPRSERLLLEAVLPRCALPWGTAFAVATVEETGGEGEDARALLLRGDTFLALEGVRDTICRARRMDSLRERATTEDGLLLRLEEAALRAV